MQNTIHLLKVALDARKSIWRRIAMRSDQTLDELHEAIYHAFDRCDEHLYSFYFTPKGGKATEALHDAHQYGHPTLAADYDPGNARHKDAAKTSLSELRLRPGQIFLYLFDFGDMWWHRVTVERTDLPDDRGKYPRIVERKGESPAQYPDLDDHE